MFLKYFICWFWHFDAVAKFAIGVRVLTELFVVVFDELLFRTPKLLFYRLLLLLTARSSISDAAAADAFTTPPNCSPLVAVVVT